MCIKAFISFLILHNKRKKHLNLVCGLQLASLSQGQMVKAWMLEPEHPGLHSRTVKSQLHDLGQISQSLCALVFPSV